MYLCTENKTLDFSHHRRQLVKGAYSSGDFPKRDMHPQYELLLALDSGVCYAIEDRKYKLAPYTLLMVPSNAYHYPIPEPPIPATTTGICSVSAAVVWTLPCCSLFFSILPAISSPLSIRSPISSGR